MQSIQEIVTEMTKPFVNKWLIYECTACHRTHTTLGTGCAKECPNCLAPKAAIREYRATPRSA